LAATAGAVMFQVMRPRPSAATTARLFLRSLLAVTCFSLSPG
jgi:hypothetical protein